MTTDVLRRPPSADGLGRGAALAALVHLGLVLALAWGVSWRRSDPTPVSAELWSAVPTVADAPAPPPQPQPIVPPVPRVTPPKPVVEPKPTPTPPAKDADIVTEKKPKKKEDPKKDEPKKEAPKKEEPKKPEPKPDPKPQPKPAEDKQAQKQQAAEQAARAQQLREEQMRRLNSQLLGAGGAGSGGGTATQSAGPSASYAGRIVARIRPNIIFNGQVGGHPKAEVLVRVAPDGTILSSKLTKSSGIAEWDDAVLRAIERTQVLPRDVDGRVPPEIPISFDPNER